MRCQLGSDVNPTDASLESVLPGVYERFASLSSKMDSHHGIMARHMNAQDDLMQVLDGRTKLFDGFRNQCNAMVARALEGYSGIATNATSPPAQNPHTLGGDSTSSPTTPPSFQGMYLSSRYTSLEEMWMEWYGLNRQFGKPIPGGFAKLEELHKAKWRGHFDPAQKRHFSKIKSIIGGLRKKMDETDANDSTVLAEYDQRFQKDFKKSVGRLLALLQEEGLVKTQKSQGRHVQTAN